MRTHLRFPLTLLAILSLAATGFLGASPATDLEQRLQQYSTLSANFRQQVTEADGYAGEVLEGRLELARPNLIHWQTLPPFAQILIADGEQIWLYDPDLAQVTVRPWTTDPVVNPGALLAGSVPIADHFDVSHDGGTYILVPLAGASTLSRVSIALNERDLPERIEIVDSLQQTTTIQLVDVVSGVELPSELFQFQVPQGVDVYQSLE